MTGEPTKDGFLNLTCFKIPVKEALELSHKYNSTLTVFMSGVMMKALLNLQNEKNPITKKQKHQKINRKNPLKHLIKSKKQNKEKQTKKVVKRKQPTARIKKANNRLKM